MVSRFFKPYYACNVLLFVTYVALRVQRLDPGELGDPDILGIPREWSIYFSLALLLFARMFSAPTLDSYLTTAFKGTAAAVLLCLWFMNGTMFRYFSALYFVALLVIPQPRFAYPRSIVALNHQSFESRVLNNNHKTFNVVWAHAAWVPRCTQLAPVFADVARKLQHPRVQFSKIDVGRWGEAAKRLGILISPTSRQLPCVLLYRRGKEIGRVPKTVGDHGDIEHRWRGGFTAKDLWKEFALDDVLREATEWEDAAKRKLQNMKTDKKAQ